MSTTETKLGDDRLLLIDGLRGIAALMVVFYHLSGALYDAVNHWFPAFLYTAFRQGNLGVDIFFVLSGFVIPHSIRNGAFSFSYLGRFALRRSIRLDPPLWATIALEILLVRLGLAWFPDVKAAVPSFKQVIVNMAYLQEFLHVDNVVSAFWSLTYEVQFYIVVVVFAVLWTYVKKLRHSNLWSGPASYILAGTAFAYSLAIYLNFVDVPLHGLFIERWFQFFLGTLAWLTVYRKSSLTVFVVVFCVCVATAFLATTTTYRLLSTLMAVATSGLLVGAGLGKRMSTWLRADTWQFLGRISYSVYLLHTPIGSRFISASKLLLGGKMSILVGIPVFLGSIAVCLFASWVLYRLLEAPSMHLARRIRLPRAAA